MTGVGIGIYLRVSLQSPRWQIPKVAQPQCIRTGQSWNGIDKLTSNQKGIGKNYEISDYQVLLGRRLQTLTHGKPEMANKFKDAPIVVGEKVL